MRRFKQQLTEENCLSILRTEKRGVLAVLGDDGYPYAVPLDFVYRDGKLFFHCAREGHKIDAVRACDKASFCVVDQGERKEGDWALWFNSVVCFGRIRVMEDHEAVLAWSRDLSAKFPVTPAETEEDIRRNGPRVAGLELTVEHMTGKRVHEK